MTIDSNNWFWPHYVLLALWALAIMVNAVNHGKPYPNEPRNGLIPVTRILVLIFLLAVGGFFK